MNKKRFLRISAVLSLACVMLSPVRSEAQLPTMGDVPWLGIFSGYERRGFQFAVDTGGQCEIYLMDTKKKVRIKKKTIKISAYVLVEDANGKLSNKALKKDAGFATEMKPGLDHDEVKFTAESAGDAKVEVKIEYDRDKIILDGRVIDPGTLKAEKIYFGFKVSVPDMYQLKSDDRDEKELKKRMRGDKIKFVRADDGKRISLKSYKDVDLSAEEMAKDGVTALQVGMGCHEGVDFVFTTDDGRGVIEFENRKLGGEEALYHGYVVKWKRLYVKEDEVKDTKKSIGARRPSFNKGISPFVIELK